MAKAQKHWIFLFLSLIILGSAFIGIKRAESNDVYSKISKNLTEFGNVYKEVSRRYVDEIDPESLMKAGIDGMLGTLDPHTTYLEEQDEQHQLGIITHGQYHGVGIPLQYRNNLVTVSDPPFLGTPAARAGIREGDVIVAVDSVLTKDIDFDEAARCIRGEAGTEVTLKIRREGESKLLEFKMIREVINIDDVRFSGVIENDIGYIQLTRFSSKAGPEIAKAIQELKSKNINGLILDLRYNPGGLLNAAVEISDFFLPKDATIVSTRGRMKGANHAFKSVKNPIYGEGPLAVLVNRFSASGSEIVAGAIQDNDRGIVVGDTTFGKGIVQTVIPFSPTSALRITTAKYYSPSGRCIQSRNYSAWSDTVLDTQTVYHTVGGREVYGGGGIVPDVNVTLSLLGDYVVDLRRKSLFFNFAVHYAAIHPDLSPDFEIDDQTLREFLAYMDEKSYKYQHPIMRDLDALEEEAADGGYDESLSLSIQQLRNAMDLSMRDLFWANADDIKDFLRLEIASKLFGTKKGVEIGLQNDPVVDKAVALLKNGSSYATLLPKTK